MKTTTMLVAGLMAAAAFATITTTAAKPYCSNTSGTFHCFSQYETGSDALALRVSCAQFSAALCPADGAFDFGGVIYDGGRSPNHANNGGHLDRDLPLGQFNEKVYVNDALFGQNVGMFYCQDVDGDGLCGEADEPGVFFCGHADLGVVDTSSFVWAGYYVVGPLFQGRDCPGSSNPIGGTVGTVSIWLTPGTGDGPGSHPSLDYGVWGGGSVGDPPGGDPQPTCNDGFDNDGDGRVDFQDRDCHFNRDCSQPFNPDGRETNTSEPAGCP